MAEADPALRDRQPWQAAHARDFGWFGKVLDEHYAGDDTNLRTLAGGVIAAHAGISVEEFEAQADAFLRGGAAPDARPRLPANCAYAPMVELLGYLRGERLRDLHRLGRRPRLHAADQRGALRHPARARHRQLARARVRERRRRRHARRASREADSLDDGPPKPVRIWSHIGRRPILAAGNSNGDIQMLDFAPAPATGRRCACS